MSTDETILEVEDLKTQFFTEEGVVRAVDGIDFDVRRGEIVGLVGESGAGKSVAVQSILRLVEEPGAIVGGEIRYKDDLLFGLEAEADDPEERTEREEMLSQTEMRTRIRGREIAIIFQDPMESLNPVYTVGSQIEEFIGLNREVPDDQAREIAMETLRDVGIPEVESRYDDYPHQFSGGMRQRVLIAMALACEPDLIVADEPTTALDVTVEAQILNLVDDLQARYDTSLVWVTHDMGVVAEICDRVNVMYLGEVVEQAPVDELFHDTKHPYTSKLLASLPRPDRTVGELDSIGGVMPEAINPPSGCRFHSRCPEAREVCAEVHPDERPSAEAGSHHTVACFRDDAFDVGYWDSPPIETEASGGFEASLTAEEGESG
jgi:peptide/nickel transport system ATP-binding protein